MSAVVQGVTGLRFVITGGAKGLGAATAARAAARGAIVTIADLDDAAGDELVGQIRADGGEAYFVHCDLTSDEELDNLMATAAEQMGGIDVLHNNAGVADKVLGSGDAVTVEGFDRDVWNRVIGLNLTAPMFAAKAALPYLRQSANASIINCGSTSTFVAYPGTIAYGASKGGIATLTKNLAVELAPDKIRVNCYCPAATDSPLVTTDAQPNSAFRKALIDTHLVHRAGKAVEIADLVCYLASPEAGFVNGQIWLIDGGALSWRNSVDMLGM